MMKALAVLFFVLILGNTNVLLAANTMKSKENDSGKTVEIVVGDELEIVLPRNPTTGYVWEVSSLDSSILKLDSSDFVPNTKAIGSGGLEVIRLHAIAEGSSEVRLIYHRTFERNVPPLKTFSATVTIRKASR
jgi:inhibitor of cysteine peptidase